MRRFFKLLKKYFIPHEHNEFKPHFLRHESFVFLCLVIIIAELAFLTQVFIIFDKTNFLASVLPGVLTTLTNEERTQNDVKPLAQNDLLTKAAELKAQDMATRGYFAHTSPDGKTPWYWLNQVGYRYIMAGENLAVNFFESEDVARAWMNSPSHRENIVKKGYEEIGIAVANGIYENKDTVFVAQFFGTPLPISIQENKYTTSIKEIANKTQVQTIPNTNILKTTKETVPPIVAAVASPISTQILGDETNLSQNENSLVTQLKFFTGKILTSPREYLTYLYGGILLFVILSLLLIMFIRFEMAHRSVLVRGITLMSIVLLLLFVNMKVLHLETKLPVEGTSASVIAY